MSDDQTDRLTAFVAAYREIEALYEQAGRAPGKSIIDRITASDLRLRADDLTNDLAARFSIDAGDVRAAGRVIDKLLSA